MFHDLGFMIYNKYMQETITTCSGTCLLALPLSILPSIVWLLFFALQDKHREKASNILKVFLWGIVIALPVVIVESLAQEIIFAPLAALALSSIAYTFVAIAFVEEFAKYLVVRLRAMPYKFFDEPQDAMVYLITAALGFAAIENLVYAFNFATNVQEVLNISIFRGVTATFLHVVASGALGYFLALSIKTPSEKRKFFYTGLVVATLLHGIYNNFIINLENKILDSQAAGGLFEIFIIATLLIISGIIILVGINKLARIKFNKNESLPKLNV